MVFQQLIANCTCPPGGSEVPVETAGPLAIVSLSVALVSGILASIYGYKYTAYAKAAREGLDAAERV